MVVGRGLTFQEGTHGFVERLVGDELFEKGAEAVGPVCGEGSSGDVDPLIFEIGCDKIGKKGEVLIEEIDVEIARCMVGVVENRKEILFCKTGLIGPIFKMAEGEGFVGKFFPPHFCDVVVCCRNGR